MTNTEKVRNNTDEITGEDFQNTGDLATTNNSDKMRKNSDRTEKLI